MSQAASGAEIIKVIVESAFAAVTHFDLNEQTLAGYLQVLTRLEKHLIHFPKKQKKVLKSLKFNFQKS